MAEEEVPDRRELGSRRVYMFPASLMDRIRAYQVAQGINSEVEAVRRLLDTALQMRDNVNDILTTLLSRFSEEKDLRVLASDVLAKHTLVATLNFGVDNLSFDLNDGSQGRISKDGETYISRLGSDTWSRVVSNRKPSTVASSGPSWEPAGSDLEDEIPF